MFSSTLLRLLRLLNARPDGVSREELRCLQGIPPDWVDRALGKLLAAGVVEERGDRVIPLPALGPLARKMELLAARLNGQAKAKDQAMDLVRVIMRGP